MNNKICKLCYKNLTLEEYHKTKNLKAYPDGHINVCKECKSKYKKERRLKNGIIVENKEVIFNFD